MCSSSGYYRCGRNLWSIVPQRINRSHLLDRRSLQVFSEKVNISISRTYTPVVNFVDLSEAAGKLLLGALVGMNFGYARNFSFNRDTASGLIACTIAPTGFQPTCRQIPTSTMLLSSTAQILLMPSIQRSSCPGQSRSNYTFFTHNASIPAYHRSSSMSSSLNFAHSPLLHFPNTNTTAAGNCDARGSLPHFSRCNYPMHLQESRP